MHVCFVCHEYPPDPHGGIGTATQVLARALAARGHAVSVVGVVPGRRQDEVGRDGGVHVVRLAEVGGRGVSVATSAVRLDRVLRQLHARAPIDVLEGPEASFGLAPTGLPALRVVRLHGGHAFFAHGAGVRPRPMRRWLERRSFARADAFCAVSAHVAAETCRLGALAGLADAADIAVLPNAIDPVRFAPRPGAEVAGEIVSVGTLCPKKGGEALVQAFALVAARQPHARLVLVGRDTPDAAHGTFGARLLASVPPVVRGRITLRGALAHDAVPEALARAQCCVFPALAEAMGIATIEAMAMGRACVVSALGPGRELVDDERTGVLRDPRDVRALADAIGALLADAPRRARLGAAAREAALARWGAEAAAARTEAFYASRLGRRRRVPA